MNVNSHIRELAKHTNTLATKLQFCFLSIDEFKELKKKWWKLIFLAQVSHSIFFIWCIHTVSNFVCTAQRSIYTHQFNLLKIYHVFIHAHTPSHEHSYIQKSVCDARAIRAKRWNKMLECVLVVCVCVCSAFYNAHEDGRIDVNVHTSVGWLAVWAGNLFKFIKLNHISLNSIRVGKFVSSKIDIHNTTHTLHTGSNVFVCTLPSSLGSFSPQVVVGFLCWSFTSPWSWLSFRSLTQINFSRFFHLIFLVFVINLLFIDFDLLTQMLSPIDILIESMPSHSITVSSKLFYNWMIYPENSICIIHCFDCTKIGEHPFSLSTAATNFEIAID